MELMIDVSWKRRWMSIGIIKVGPFGSKIVLKGEM